MTIAHLLKRAGFDEDVAEVIGREGKIGVTTDLASDRRGGATQAGISQAYFGKNPDGSWKRSKEQIAAMTPGEIKSVYRDIYRVPDKFTDPRVRKVMFDMTTNAGPTANGILQRSVNGLLPADKRLKVDNIAGSGTLAAAKGVDQGRLAGKLLDGYSAHHTQLIANRPDLYAENKNGWRNRVNGLRTTIGAMKAPTPPVVVKGTLQPQPVLVKGQLQPPAPSRLSPIIQPGSPIRSMPMLSAPATQVMNKQAMRPISERMQRLRARRGECHTCEKPNVDGLVCDCGDTKEWTKEASRTKELQKLLNDSDISSDIIFFTDGKERATACIGDWHDKTEFDVAVQFGLANWDNFERPNDTEIGKPTWATMSMRQQRKGRGKKASIASLLRQARNATHRHPTEAQRAAGNYRHGKVTIHGLRISIENPKDSIRRGKDKNGKPWANRLAGDYGFFTGTKAVDDDAIDVFIGDDLDSELVTVIDQHFDGKFDESKFVVCAATQAKAEKLYLSAYQKGWKLGDVSTTTVQQLKEWLKDGDHKKPFKGQMVKAAAALRREIAAARTAWGKAVARGPDLTDIFSPDAGHVLTLPARSSDVFSQHLSSAEGTLKHGWTLEELKERRHGGLPSDQWRHIDGAAGQSLYETVINPVDIMSRLPDAEIFKLHAGRTSPKSIADAKQGGRIFKGIPRNGVETAIRPGGVSAFAGRLLGDRWKFRKDMTDGQWFTGFPGVAESYAGANVNKSFAPSEKLPSFAWEKLHVDPREISDRVRAWHSDVNSEFLRPYLHLRSLWNKSASFDSGKVICSAPWKVAAWSYTKKPSEVTKTKPAALKFLPKNLKDLLAVSFSSKWATKEEQRRQAK